MLTYFTNLSAHDLHDLFVSYVTFVHLPQLHHRPLYLLFDLLRR